MTTFRECADELQQHLDSLLSELSELLGRTPTIRAVSEATDVAAFVDGEEDSDAALRITSFFRRLVEATLVSLRGLDDQTANLNPTLGYVDHSKIQKDLRRKGETAITSFPTEIPVEIRCQELGQHVESVNNNPTRENLATGMALWFLIQDGLKRNDERS